VAVLSFSAVRQRIAAVVEALAGMAQSPYLDDQLTSQSARSASDGRFTVTVRASSVQFQQRQKRPEGVEVYSDISVEFLTNFRDDAAVADYDAALDRASTVLAAIMSDTSLVNLHLDFVSMEEAAIVIDSPVTRTTLNFRAKHRIALQ
jgi:hypothetical protein